MRIFRHVTLLHRKTLTITLHKKSISIQSCITSAKQLHDIKKQPKWWETYRVLDVSWDLEERDYSIDHFTNRIPASKYFDLEVCRDVSSPYKMMLPTAGQFADYVSELGISNDHHVIIYDNHSKYAMFSSPRLWWMFRLFGHDNVSVLNGGLGSWIQSGYKTVSGGYTEDEELPTPDTKFKATFNPEFVKEYDSVKARVDEGERFLLESRARETEPESIFGAEWTPFNELLDGEYRSIRTPSEIHEYFSSKNIDLHKEIVTTCGRGVSASVVSLCIYHATGRNVPVYDGSWSEWSGRSAPKE